MIGTVNKTEPGRTIECWYDPKHDSVSFSKPEKGDLVGGWVGAGFGIGFLSIGGVLFCIFLAIGGLYCYSMYLETAISDCCRRCRRGADAVRTSCSQCMLPCTQFLRRGVESSRYVLFLRGKKPIPLRTRELLSYNILVFVYGQKFRTFKDDTCT